jgi:hypothetical protein
MDDRGRVRRGWDAPRVEDYGTLADITADVGMLGHFGIGIAQAASIPQQPGPGGGGDVLDENDRGGGGGPLGGGDGPGGGGDVAGEGGAGGAGGGSGGDGGLPFTGLALAVIGSVGAGLTAAGAALRERLRRGGPGDRGPDA